MGGWGGERRNSRSRARLRSCCYGWLSGPWTSAPSQLLLLGLNWWWAAAALLLTGFLIVSDAMLLGAVMRIFGHRVQRGTAFLYSLVGWFFSNVAPSTVGGDIFRGVQLSRVGTPVGAAVRVILSIRLLSLATLVVVMLAGFPVALGLVEARRDILVLAGTLSVALAALTAVVLLTRFHWGSSILARWRLFEKLKKVSDGFRELLMPSPDVAGAWIAALTQHLLRVGVLASLPPRLALAFPSRPSSRSRRQPCWSRWCRCPSAVGACASLPSSIFSGQQASVPRQRFRFRSHSDCCACSSARSGEQPGPS